MAEPRSQFGTRAPNSRSPGRGVAGGPGRAPNASSTQGGLFDGFQWWQGAIAIAVGVTVVGVAAFFLGAEGEEKATKELAKAQKGKPNQKNKPNTQQSASDAKEIYNVLVGEAKKAQNAGKYDVAENYYKKAEAKVKEAPNNANELVIVHYLWSTLYAVMKQPDKQEQQLNNALGIVHKKKQVDVSAKIVVLSALADFFMSQKRYNEARTVAEEQVEISLKIAKPDDRRNLGYAKGQLATISWKLEDYTKASELFGDCLKYLKEKKAIDVLYFKYATAYADMLLESGKCDEAVRFFLDEIEFSKSINMKATVPVFKQALANAYYQAGDTIKALSIYDEAYQLVSAAAKRGNSNSSRGMQQLANLLLASIANICWELRKEEEARKHEETIKSISAIEYFPHTRSRFLETYWAKLNDKEFALKVEVRKSIKEPKISSGSVLEFIFENPNGGETVSVDRVVTSEDLKNRFIEVKYPEFESQEFVVKVGDWLGVTVCAWRDNAKTDKLGLHRQLARMDTPEMQKRYAQN